MPAASPLASAIGSSDRFADGRADFNFFWGSWRVRHRRLKRRLAGSDEWENFDGRCATRPIIGGLGNIDDNEIELPDGTYLATTVRLFRPKTQRWSIWWVDARDPTLQPPVEGAFENGVGTFYGDDEYEGRAIRVRFLWSDITPISARWKQAFSIDGGANWETNWRMDFTRVE